MSSSNEDLRDFVILSTSPDVGQINDEHKTMSLNGGTSSLNKKERSDFNDLDLIAPYLDELKNEDPPTSTSESDVKSTELVEIVKKTNQETDVGIFVKSSIMSSSNEDLHDIVILSTSADLGQINDENKTMSLNGGTSSLNKKERSDFNDLDLIAPYLDELKNEDPPTSTSESDVKSTELVEIVKKANQETDTMSLNGGTSSLNKKERSDFNDLDLIAPYLEELKNEDPPTSTSESDVKSTELVEIVKKANQETDHTCDLCEDKPATVSCEECGENYCQECDKFIHKKAKAKHTRRDFTHEMCDNCEDHPAAQSCDKCAESYCMECDKFIHKKAKAEHIRRVINKGYIGKMNNLLMVFQHNMNIEDSEMDIDVEDCEDKVDEFTLDHDIVILIMGETGVGKSTWINGIANYLAYNTLEEAEEGENVSVIQNEFTMTDDNLQQIKVTTHPIKNANQVVTGESDTQITTTYRFVKGQRTVRLIDTPGIGDTRGTEKDKENFQNILDHIAKYEVIHGIVILLKPNNSRLTVMFRFCIQELLTHLHKAASRNIVFCFTNSRGTFYRPGDTLPSMEMMLKKIKDVDIPLQKENIYCIDNESVRFLAAVKQRVNFSMDEKRNYSVSWEKSVHETNRMFKYICTLHPHSVSDTLSLNDARQMIIRLTKPLAEIHLNVQRNIEIQKQQVEEIIAAKSLQEKLKKSLVYRYSDLDIRELSYPRTVCTSPKCVKVVPIKGNISKTDYKTHCHEHCYLTAVDAERAGHPELQKCWAMMPNGNKCRICSCNWQTHMHIYFETIPVFKEELNEDVQIQISDKQEAMTIIEERKQAIAEEVEQLKYEQKHVSKVSAKLAHFLKTNSITPYNDALVEYLNHLIKEEKEKPVDCRNNDIIKGLQENVDSYTEEVKILELAIASGCDNKDILSLPAIYNLEKSLYNLKLNGKSIKKMMSVSKRARVDINTEQEIVCNTVMKNKKHKQKSYYRKFTSAVQNWNPWTNSSAMGQNQASSTDSDDYSTNYQSQPSE